MSFSDSGNCGELRSDFRSRGEGGELSGVTLTFGRSDGGELCGMVRGREVVI